jgi:glycosyltransferase involved in cell wall biosynthesis
VICCSESEFNAYRRIGIKARYINNGISMQQPAQPALQAKRQKFRIITSGRIVDQKNPYLFNAIATYFQEFEDFEFLWAGDGTERHVLTANNIIVTGWLPTQEVKALGCTADMYFVHFLLRRAVVCCAGSTGAKETHAADRLRRQPRCGEKRAERRFVHQRNEAIIKLLHL